MDIAATLKLRCLICVGSNVVAAEADDVEDEGEEKNASLSPGDETPEGLLSETTSPNCADELLRND